jgi:hypothetical protein
MASADQPPGPEPIASDRPAERAAARPSERARGRTDYAGAVYGSMLAASVIAGTGPRQHPLPALGLMLLLVTTGLVFWLAHVYARLAGDRERGVALTRAEVRSVGAAEWPLVEAAFPPAAVAGLGWLLGLDNSVTAWAALAVAVAGQVGWAMVAAARASGRRPAAVVTAGLVNLGLGLTIVALKALLTH